MASIDKRPNGKWRARWREPDGTQRALHFVRKLDAERHLVEVQAAMHRGAYVSPEAGEILLRDYAATWKDGQPWAPSSRARYESILTKHVLPRFGHLPLRAIRTSDVRAWVASMAAEGYAAASIKSHFGVLRAIMRGAIEDQRLATSPCQGVKMPRADRQARDHDALLTPLTTAQVHELAAAVPERYRGLVLVSAGLGLRQGEACALTLDRVDMLRKTVRIDRQIVTLGSGSSFGPPKTAASAAVIPMPAAVGRVLARHLEQFPPGEHGLIFTADDGTMLGRMKWGRIFTAAAASLGLDVTSHALHHYCASLLISSGRSVRAVQRFLRHGTPQETLSTYSHLWPDDDELLRSSIDAAFESDEDSVRTEAK